MGSWDKGSSSWKDGQIPKILITNLKLDKNASPKDKVNMAYEKVFSMINQTSNFKRDKVIDAIQSMKYPPGASEQVKKQIDLDKVNVATAAIVSLVSWANSFIDLLNEYAKAKKPTVGPGADGSSEDLPNPLQAVAHISPADFELVANYLQYVDAYSVADAAEAAHSE